MTGQYSIRNGMSLVLSGGAAGGLQKDDVTLGKMFKSVGYNTTYMGKWHLGPQNSSQPHSQGFDQWLHGFEGSTDGVLYTETLKTSKMPDALTKAATIHILEGKAGEEAKQVRVYDRAYRLQIEAAGTAGKWVSN